MAKSQAGWPCLNVPAKARRTVGERRGVSPTWIPMRSPVTRRAYAATLATEGDGI